MIVLSAVRIYQMRGGQLPSCVVVKMRLSILVDMRLAFDMSLTEIRTYAPPYDGFFNTTTQDVILCRIISVVGYQLGYRCTAAV
jgi:hypothetical protein